MKAAEIIKVEGCLEIVEVGMQGPPGIPGDERARWGKVDGRLEDQEDLTDLPRFKADLALSYAIAKL